MPDENRQPDLERIVREQYGLLLADLARRTRGDLELAEEALSEAIAAAVVRWRSDPPLQPIAWLAQTARKRLADHFRRRERESAHRRSWFGDRPAEHDPAPEEAKLDAVIPDERLALLFTCCHPALAPEAQVPLLLTSLGGLTTPEVARAFLVPEPTLAQRLVRAKRKVRDAGIPFREPSRDELPERLELVLEAVYLIFNEGFAATSGVELVREGLCGEARELARLIAELLPKEPEARGLWILIRINHARRHARTGPDGDLVLLADQDRSLWDREEIDAACRDLEALLALRRPGPFQIQAAIAAVHGEAPTAEETDWAQILGLYDELLRHRPTPVIQLNRAVALAEIAGPEPALEVVEQLARERELDNYLYLHSTRAELARRCGHVERARASYLRALELAGAAPERRFLTRRLSEIQRPLRD